MNGLSVSETPRDRVGQGLAKRLLGNENRTKVPENKVLQCPTMGLTHYFGVSY